MEIYYETEWYRPPPDLRPALKNQAQRFPARGASVRRLDHMNLLTSDVAALRHFAEDVVGLRTTEMIVLDGGKEAGGWVTCNNKSYDLAFTLDHYGARGRFHHVTYAVDSREDVLRAADIFLEAAFTSRRVRTSTRFSRRSSSMSMSPAATASRWRMPARVWCWRPTGSRLSGPRPNARRDRPGV
jgi:hypothetical protein